MGLGGSHPPSVARLLRRTGALPVGGDGIRNGGAEDGAQRELRPTGSPESFRGSRDSSVFNPCLIRG
jgi:hypothetical protein